jgi:hypothetical protein
MSGVARAPRATQSKDLRLLVCALSFRSVAEESASILFMFVILAQPESLYFSFVVSQVAAPSVG